MGRKKQIEKFIITGDSVHKYVNFINDNGYGDQLINYETGFKDGDFYLEIEGNQKIIENIKNTKINKEEWYD